MVQKKVYDCVCSLHLVTNFVIFFFFIPKHLICFKQTFFFMQQKKRYAYLKNLKNLDIKNKKIKSENYYSKGKTLKFILFSFLFQIYRSKNKGVRRLFSKSINKKVIEFNILIMCM